MALGQILVAVGELTVKKATGWSSILLNVSDQTACALPLKYVSNIETAYMPSLIFSGSALFSGIFYGLCQHYLILDQWCEMRKKKKKIR